MRTIHIICNAHIDPVWLWPWQAGLDEVLATCRSACDRLDKHPDLIFTRGEAWVYEQIERTDPGLFERIRGHIAEGRWQIVGGWYLQPDCNLPSGFALEKQIELGKRYFEERFNYFPTVVMNVDSFGHAATLPKLMRKAGQEFYVMMRPGEHEMNLPARIFRWRGFEDGPEVTVFRIAGSYATTRGLNLDHFKRSLTELPEDIKDTMCFVGIGDHGGGPTEEMIQWCREHREAIEGATLEFSSPQKFFEKIKTQQELLPLVVGELQYHAVGCYSVYRPTKVALRKAEHMALQAGIALAKDPAPEPEAPRQLDEAWRRVCFHHFHDTLGGTCLASAYEQVNAQLGQAQALSDERTHYSLRRQLNALPDDSLQRMIFFNASDQPYNGYVEFEPWLEFQKWQPDWTLLDENDQCLPCQEMESEALVQWPTRILLRLDAEPGALRVVRIDPEAKEPVGGTSAPLKVWEARGAGGTIDNGSGCRIDLNARLLQLGAALSLPLPRLEMIEDLTDTWSHGINAYAEGPVVTPQWQPGLHIDHGPLMASLIQDGRIGDSRLRAEWRVYAGDLLVELFLRVHWMEARRVLKYTMSFESEIQSRLDGIPGGVLRRASTGCESPFRDLTLASLANGDQIGIVAPDVFALDAKPHRMRMTLLRSPPFAQHIPPAGGLSGVLQTPSDISPRQRFTDQGEHLFRFRFFAGRDLDVQALERHACMLQRPLIAADLTRGMPTRRQKK